MTSTAGRAISGVLAAEILTGRVNPLTPDTWTELEGTDYSRLNLRLPMLAPPEGYQAVFEEAQGVGDRVLRGNWGAVRAVAKAFLVRGEMDARRDNSHRTHRSSLRKQPARSVTNVLAEYS